MKSKRPLRILQLHTVDRISQFEGVEKMAFEISRNLNRTTGFEVALAVNEGSLLEKAKAAGIRVFPIEIGGGRRQLVDFMIRLRRICREFKPDLIHSHHRYSTLASHLMPLRTFRVLHTFHVEQFDKKFLRFFGDHMTAVSQAVKNHFVVQFRVPADKVTVIYNGVELPGGAPILAAQLKRNESRINIVIAARLEEQKGHEYFIRALALIRPEFRNRLHVVFLGEGSKRPVLEKMVHEKKLEKVIEFAGFKENVWEYLERCDFCVLPSLWEGFGLSLIEASLCGKPVIASKVGGIPEILKDRKTGLLVPPRDPEALAAAITELVEKPELRIEYGKYAHEIALSRFTVPIMMDSYQTLYRRLLRK